MSQVPVSPGGAGAPAGSGVNGANNAGAAALGLGCGGGGGSWWGGTGGPGKFGGGGGGAGGYFSLGSINWAGGDGGQGVVVIAYYNGASLTSAMVLTSGTSVTVPASVTSAKVWAIGAGGGGGGSTSNDGTAGGSGAAGGVAYVTKSVSVNDIISYTLGAGGRAGHGYVAATAGGNTSVTIAGTTIYGNGGGAGAINSGANATGGTYSGGDGGSNGGGGYARSGDVGGGGGGGIGAAAGTQGGLDGGTGASANNVSGLFEACAIAAVPTLPTLTSFTPTAGLSGTVVTITGTGFTGTTAVTFGGVNAFSYTVNNATEIVATVDASCVTGSVSVVTPFVTLSKPIYFVSAPQAPSISNFTPASAQMGQVVTINGSHFLGSTSVSFGGSNAAAFTIVSDYQILATVGNGSSGSVNVISSSGTGTYAGFTYVGTTQASAIVFSAVDQTQLTVNWTNGTATKRAVFMKQGTGAITNPSVNTTYNASTDWNSKGTQLGSSGYYCIYNGTGATATVTGLNAGTSYTVQVFEYNGSAGSEVYLTSTASNNPNTQATLGTLPVIWGGFSVKMQNAAVLLQWNVIQETDINYYTVQHSTDARTWTNLAQIAANGDAGRPKEYSWLHTATTDGNNFYRIALLESNGTIRYSGIEMIATKTTVKTGLVNTLVNDHLLLILDKAEAVRIFNARGQLMMTQEGRKGLNDFTISHFTPGVYYVQTRSGLQKAIKY